MPMVMHPLVVRLTHWINAVAIAGMVMSGWAIYDANPFLGFSIPRWATLGSWLGAAIAWHFAVMWLLVANGLVYVVYGLVSRHFRRAFLPLGPRLVWRDLRAALALRLEHRPAGYNAVQRLAYVGVLLLGVVLVLSGLSLWKPVQFQGLAGLLGGYEGARRVHFVAMAGIVAVRAGASDIGGAGARHLAGDDHRARPGAAMTRSRQAGRHPGGSAAGAAPAGAAHAGAAVLLRGGLSLGALTMLTGCNLQDNDAVDRALFAMSRFNDRVQALLFDPDRLAPTYSGQRDHRAVPV